MDEYKEATQCKITKVLTEKYILLNYEQEYFNQIEEERKQLEDDLRRSGINPLLTSQNPRRHSK